MKMIKPITVTPAMIESSNLPEDTAPEWEAGGLPILSPGGLGESDRHAAFSAGDTHHAVMTNNSFTIVNSSTLQPSASRGLPRTIAGARNYFDKSTGRVAFSYRSSSTSGSTTTSLIADTNGDIVTSSVAFGTAADIALYNTGQSLIRSELSGARVWPSILVEGDSTFYSYGLPTLPTGVVRRHTAVNVDKNSSFAYVSASYSYPDGDNTRYGWHLVRVNLSTYDMTVILDVRGIFSPTSTPESILDVSDDGRYCAILRPDRTQNIVCIYDADDAFAETQITFNATVTDVNFNSTDLWITKINSPRIAKLSIETWARTDYSIGADYITDPSFGAALGGGNLFIQADQAATGNGYTYFDTQANTIEPAVGIPYAAGDIVKFDQQRWESATDDNTAVPDKGASATPPVWINKGFVNELKLFDGLTASQSVASGESIDVEICAGQLVSGLAVFNADGGMLRVKMVDPDEGLVYDTGDTQLINNDSITNWFSYFFEPYNPRRDVAVTDLPPYPEARITVTIEQEGGNPAVGEVIIGSIRQLGTSSYGGRVGIVDYSRKEADIFGNFFVQERRFNKSSDYDFIIPAGQASGVQTELSNFRAKPAVWVGEESRGETIVYGYYKDFDILISNPSFDNATITVEGL